MRPVAESGDRLGSSGFPEVPTRQATGTARLILGEPPPKDPRRLLRLSYIPDAPAGIPNLLREFGQAKYHAIAGVSRYPPNALRD